MQLEDGGGPFRSWRRTQSRTSAIERPLRPAACTKAAKKAPRALVPEIGIPAGSELGRVSHRTRHQQRVVPVAPCAHRRPAQPSRAALRRLVAGRVEHPYLAPVGAEPAVASNTSSLVEVETAASGARVRQGRRPRLSCLSAAARARRRSAQDGRSSRHRSPRAIEEHAALEGVSRRAELCQRVVGAGQTRVGLAAQSPSPPQLLAQSPQPPGGTGAPADRPGEVKDARGSGRVRSATSCRSRRGAQTRRRFQGSREEWRGRVRRFTGGGVGVGWIPTPPWNGMQCGERAFDPQMLLRFYEFRRASLAQFELPNYRVTHEFGPFLDARGTRADGWMSGRGRRTVELGLTRRWRAGHATTNGPTGRSSSSCVPDPMSRRSALDFSRRSPRASPVVRRPGPTVGRRLARDWRRRVRSVPRRRGRPRDAPRQGYRSVRVGCGSRPRVVCVASVALPVDDRGTHHGHQDDGKLVRWRLRASRRPVRVTRCACARRHPTASKRC